MKGCQEGQGTSNAITAQISGVPEICAEDAHQKRPPPRSARDVGSLRSMGRLTGLHHLPRDQSKSHSQWLCSVDGDGERLRADASAGVGVSGHIGVGAGAQGDIVDLPRSRNESVRTSPVPRSAACGLRAEVNRRTGGYGRSCLF